MCMQEAAAVASQLAAAGISVALLAVLEPEFVTQLPEAVTYTALQAPADEVALLVQSGVVHVTSPFSQALLQSLLHQCWGAAQGSTLDAIISWAPAVLCTGISQWGRCPLHLVKTVPHMPHLHCNTSLASAPFSWLARPPSDLPKPEPPELSGLVLGWWAGVTHAVQLCLEWADVADTGAWQCNCG